MKTMKVRLTFTEAILGTMPNNKDIYRDYVASKSPVPAESEEEIECIQSDAGEKGMTVFPKLDDGTPFLYDYQIKGFFKGACSGLRRVPGTLSSKIKAYKKLIDLSIFVQPRRVLFHDYGTISECQRPLRAQTAQGERISLALSEEIQEGAWIEFEIKLYVDGDADLIREWLDYGADSGIGQWRNSGKGRFLWEEFDQKGNVICGNKQA